MSVCLVLTFRALALVLVIITQTSQRLSVDPSEAFQADGCEDEGGKFVVNDFYCSLGKQCS